MVDYIWLFLSKYNIIFDDKTLNYECIKKNRKNGNKWR